jgi:biopolymer transport protein ExbB
MLEAWFNNSDLLMAGGWIVGLILLLTFVMWALILDRYVFLYRDIRHLVTATFERWHALRTDDPKRNRRLRIALTRGFHDTLGRWLAVIRVITAILPLLGLLGTVAGMITTFEVMTVFGTGNIRGMADGISQALVTTMAGLLAALSGLYFANDLEQRIDSQTNHLSEHLGVGEDESA